MSEETKKTQKDLLNDDKFIATLVDYNRDRYGVSPLSAEEALETFLEDYRSLNSNTVGAFNFINYAEDIKDEEFKKNLGDAYKTVDTELENFYADDSTKFFSDKKGEFFGKKAEAIGDYVMYSILDPINVFGFGAGKLVSGALGRQAVKNAVGKALGTKLKTGIAVGAGEGAVSASVDLGTQLAEKEIGAREEISPTQIAVAGGAGAILGGGIGALAARGTDKARLEMEDLIPETKTDSGVSVIEQADTVAQKDIETLFPYIKKQTKKKAGKEELKPLDEKDVIEGEKFLQENFSPEEADLFRASLNNETMIAVRGAISDFVTENPASAAAVYKPGDRISEFVGNIFKERLDLQGNPIVGDVVPETNSTLQQFTEKLINRGISPEKFGVLFKADLSQAGRTMQKVGQLKKLFDSQDELGNFNLGLTDIAKKLNPEQQETLKYLREVDKSQSEFGSTYGQFVDLWRGLLVTSPATTLRNIIGSMLRVPSETSSRALDRAFQNWERSLLGREELPDLPNYKINGILSAFGNMSKSIEMARYIGKNFTEVDKKIFKTVEDFDNAFNTGKDTGIMAGAAKVVKRLNFLNMAQDRAIKSGAFIASIDREIIRAVRNGSITDEGINGIESIIRQNKLNLINNKMIDDAIADSYRMTYQIRDAGKETELPLIGPALSGFQKIVNSSPTLKILVPFPNFQANAFAYLTNRVPGLSFYKPIKSAISLAKKGGKEVAKKDRIKLTELDNKIKETTDALGQANKTEAASLRKDLISMTQERTDLQVKFGGIAEDLRKLKQGISESIDGMILLSVAYQIRDSQAGGDETKWYELKDVADNEGKLYDLRPIFPLTPFLYIAEVLRRQMQGKTEADVIPETLSNDALEAMIGTSVRAGPIGKMFREGRKIFESESPFDKAKVGQLVGETVGYLAAGLLTPLRPVSDIARTFSDPESRLYLDPALKKNIDVAQPWYTNAWRAMMADLTRGVEPLVGGVDSKAFGKVPSYATPTTAKEPSTRTTPVIKQLTGMAQRGPRDAVEGELLKMDIDPFRARMYSGVSEYDNIANRISGSLTEQVLLPRINSNEYQNKSFGEKKEILEGFFFQPSETKRDLGFFKGDFSNVRKQTNAIMAKEYPILTDLKNLRKQGSKKINKALEKFGATPDLSYVNERDPKNAARIKELKNTLDQINYNIKFRGDDTPTFSRGLGFAGTATEGRIQEGSLSPVRKNKGGYVSQMNALGFDEGGYVGGDEMGLATSGRDRIEDRPESVRVPSTQALDITGDGKVNHVDLVEALRPTAPQEYKEMAENIASLIDKKEFAKAAGLTAMMGASVVPLGRSATAPARRSITRELNEMPDSIDTSVVKSDIAPEGLSSTPNKISADEVVADDATKTYAKSIEDADRFDNVEDWQAEVKVIKKSNNVDLSVRTPELEASAKRLINKEIPREEHLRSIDKHKPVRGFDELPRQPTDKAVVFALDNSQREKGLFQLPEEVTKKLNVKRSPLKVGDSVQGRLDIPAYLYHDTWIVTLLSPLIKNAKGNRTSIYGKAIHYAPDSKKGYVEFKAAEGLGQKIATGHNKTPYATVVGTVKDLDPERIRKKASKLLNDPEWVQLSFDPRRQTSFYVRKGADGLPVHTPIASADEVIQIGPLVLAKNAVAKTKKDGTPWTDLNRGGAVNKQMDELGL